MKKSLLAGALATALAITAATPTTVQASNRDVERFIVGAGLLALLATAINAQQNDKDDRKRRESRKPVVVQPERRDPPRVYVKPSEQTYRNDHRYENYQGHRHGANRYPGHVEARATLPKSCQKTFDVRNGKRTFLKAKCLKKRGIRADSLPYACQRTLDMPGNKKDRKVFGRKCLLNNGYRIR